MPETHFQTCLSQYYVVSLSTTRSVPDLGILEHPLCAQKLNSDDAVVMYADVVLSAKNLSSSAQAANRRDLRQLFLTFFGADDVKMSLRHSFRVA